MLCERVQFSIQLAAKRSGMSLLAEGGWEKVRAGLTTAAEVRRVVAD
jgi:type II secretory ATPase GspE/PulE/Tfp pilus assembly ATPase PilB-like protein